MLDIHCLTWTGGPISNMVRALLFDTAQSMLEDEITAYRIKTSDAEGEITTEGERANIGGFCGVVFHAQLDSENGSFKVVYIVKENSHLRLFDIPGFCDEDEEYWD